MATTINASTTGGLIQTADTSGVLQLQSNGTTMQTVDSTGSYGQLMCGTAQATTSGTSITFGSLPPWVKRITVMANQISTSGSSNILIRLGTSGGVVSTGYLSSTGNLGAGGNSVTVGTNGFAIVTAVSASNLYTGTLVLTNISGNSWVATGLIIPTVNSNPMLPSGSIALSGTLTQLVLTTSNGTDTFDNGSINILYEG